jgi:hypothetical protein
MLGFRSFLLMTVMFSSWTSFAVEPCEMAENGKKFGSYAIAVALSCDNPEAIAEDIDDLMTKFNICTAQRAELCPLISNYLVGQIEEQIPMDWRCSPKVAKTLATQLVSKGCEILVGQVL